MAVRVQTADCFILDQRLRNFYPLTECLFGNEICSDVSRAKTTVSERH